MAYRIKEIMYSNVPHDVRVSGMFSVNASTAAIGTITRPSAGASASAGAGNMFTVTRPTASTFLWVVTLAEQYIQPVWTNADITLVPTSANAGTPGVAPATLPSGHITGNTGKSLTCYSTAVDLGANTGAATGSNTFFVYLADTAGNLVTAGGVTVPTGYNLMVNFEACFKGAVSPTSL